MYKVQWDSDGKPIIACDTLAEAIELAKHGSPLNGTNQQSKSARAEPQTVSDQVTAVFAGVNSKAKNLLKGIANHPQGVELNESLGQECGTEPAGFGGVLGAVSKEAKKVDLTVDQLVRSEIRFDGTRRFRWLAPTKLLLEHKNKLQ
jgi:hypothetical protein